MIVEFFEDFLFFVDELYGIVGVNFKRSFDVREVCVAGWGYRFVVVFLYVFMFKVEVCMDVFMFGVVVDFREE